MRGRAVTKLGLAPGASPDRLKFTSDLPQALGDADFVQENAPERPELKVKLFADIDDATPPDAIIASSSSGITMSVMQAQCRRPERTVIGHPFNPPHVIPLVEVVGGTKTAPETIRDAMAFYASIGKKPIHLKKELPGHVANRIQSALYREVVYLIGQGVLDVADADDAVSWGPGLRWGVMGPNLLWHLGGGQGGIQHFMDTLMPRMAAGWPGLGNPELTPELQQQIIKGVLEEARRPVDRRARRPARRDAVRSDRGARQAWAIGRERLGRRRNDAERDVWRAGNDANDIRLCGLRAGVTSTRTRKCSTHLIERTTTMTEYDRKAVRAGSQRRRAAVLHQPRRLRQDATLVTGCAVPDGVAVDVEAGHVYWTNMGMPPVNDGSIERVDLDGGNRTTIVPSGGTYTPKQLHLDTVDRKLYWSDREGMRVMRCDLDGSNVETLVQTGVGEDDRHDETNWCVGVAVDHVGGHLYWTQKGPSDAGLGRILRAGIDIPAGESAAHRSDVEVVFKDLP